LYAWDARNRLAQMDGGSTASFAYDALGRRTSKTVLGGQTGFLYDGWNPVQELSGTTATANLLTGGVDEYFQRMDASGTRSLLTDALGSTLALTDSSGTIQTSYGYEPYGNTTVTGVGTSNSFSYTGRELDATGLYFYRARYYSPQFGRFISEDPLGISGGGPNFYAYTGGDPVDFDDPFGLCWVYRQSTHALYYQDEQTGTTTPIYASGYSGVGAGLNDSESESVGEDDDPNNSGPIPRGSYTIGPQQLNVTHGPRPKKLPASMRLIPDASNDMFGRAGFLIHGDNQAENNTASQGCIILPLWIRNKIGRSSDRCLQVTQ